MLQPPNSEIPGAEGGDPGMPLRGASARRLRWAASVTLGCVMGGHMLLETARDALFLANVAVERLPLVTIGVALLALGLSRLDGGRGNRFALVAFQLAAALGTFALWGLVLATREWTFYALYLWSGIITSLVVVRFWLLLGDLFTIREGKRLFASIAMGGSIGALAGSGLAALLAPSIAGEGLLLAATALYAVSALGPTLLFPSPDPRRHQTTVEEETGWSESLAALAQHPYAARIALLVVVGAMSLTLGDYLFKSVLTARVEADQLAVWLSQIYLGLNVLSIAMLAVGVTAIVRWLGVDRSLTVLPGLVGLAALGVLAGGGLVATIFLKLVDGTLRYSLHKTATELLYLPMSSALRSAVKTGIDVVGQTGGKAVGSLLILGLVLAPETEALVACAVVLSCGLWVALALRLRVAYLDVFRDTLNRGTIDTVLEHPELDLESAGSLIRALSDPDEHRSLAALRLLVERGQADLIPSLIVYHPSPQVVTAALDLFAAEERSDVLHLLAHLLDHEDPNVRAASVRATWALDRDDADLRALVDSPCLAIRVSAVAGLVARGEEGPELYRQVLDEVLAYHEPDPRRAAATAARLDYHTVCREALLRMASDPDHSVVREAMLAICASGDDWFVPHLVGLLGERRVREDVRRALLEQGERALSVLAEQLVDPRTPISVLRHIPRTVARFRNPAAARVLCESLASVDHGMVRFKLLRGLETLLLTRGRGRGIAPAFASIVDLKAIRRELDRTLERSRALLDLERDLVRWQVHRPGYATVGGQLLVDLLDDKRELATGRLFMMLGLMYPDEDFSVIHDALTGDDPAERGSAAELVETLLPREISTPLLRQMQRRAELERRARAAEKDWKDEESYLDVLRRARRDASRSVRAVALYHAGELDIALETARDAGERGRGESLSALERGLAAVRDLFEGRPPKPASAPVTS